jgi:photosystem II stability/assembly factor-like uncharacterized protein
MHAALRTLACFATLVLTIAIGRAQATWSRQSPLPYAPQLDPQEIAFSATRGYVVGANDRLLETTDGGITWHERALTGAILNVENYGAVTFFGPAHGWLVGDDLSWTNSCFRTVDGGATWTPMSVVTGGQWSHLDFVSTTRGWAGAWGALYVTNDGGGTWAPQDFGVSNRIDAMDFRDANVGILSSQGALRRTQNGGQTWSVVHGHEAFAIEWLDATTIIASTISSGGPDFARSTDAGLTWQTIQVPGVDLQEPVRVDATTVIAGTQFGELYRSTDAGLTWNKVWNSGKTGSMNGGTFTSPTDGFVVESGNLILRTRDGGQNWFYASNGMGAEYEDVKMFDARCGLVAGAGVLRTEDGGRSWIPTTPESPFGAGRLRDLSLVAPSFAFASGDHGMLLKSLDAGLNWQAVQAPAGYPNNTLGSYAACSFITSSEGWIAGAYAEIAHTTDGGATWQQQFFLPSSADGAYDMDFVDGQHGWVVGTFGSGVLRTADGGNSWNFHAFPAPSNDGRAIDFATSLVGWAGSTSGWIARSADGGLTWTRQQLPGVTPGTTHIDSLHALSATECWAASTDDGRVFHTTNAGAAWTELVTPFHDDYDGYTGIVATAGGEVWVAGYRGAVSHFGAPVSAVSALCFGDGSGAVCPCGNESLPGAGQGCLNSTGVGGVLTGSGAARILADTLVIAGTNMPNSSALYFQGSQMQSAGQGATFGDGLRCVGGTIVRLATSMNSGGASSYPDAGDAPISVRGLITTPGLRTYQVWYRNPAPFCTPSTFNLTNGLSVSWSL